MGLVKPVELCRFVPELKDTLYKRLLAASQVLGISPHLHGKVNRNLASWFASVQSLRLRLASWLSSLSTSRWTAKAETLLAVTNMASFTRLVLTQHCW